MNDCIFEQREKAKNKKNLAIHKFLLYTFEIMYTLLEALMLKAYTYILTFFTVLLGLYLVYADNDFGFNLESSAFKNQGLVPIGYTCLGENISPPLSWSGAPSGTMSYALIVTDSDAPKPDFVHWLVYNIPSGISVIKANAGSYEWDIPGAVVGKNSFQHIGYDGPCPPQGKPHHYIFTLYALNTVLELPPGRIAAEFLQAADEYILGKTTLMGIFQNQR